MKGDLRAVTLGEGRRRAPCLPAELLSCFAAFPLEYPGHGHPGLLFAKRSPGDSEGPAETWIEASLAPHLVSYPERAHSANSLTHKHTHTQTHTHYVRPGTDGGGVLGIPSVLLVCM